MVFSLTPLRPQSVPSDYVLGAGDQVAIHVLDLPEIDAKPLTIELTGWLTVPLLGRMQVAGLTTAGFESALVEKLARYLHEPHVTVSVVEYRSQPVSVLGAVNKPGIHQVQGRKTLIEVLSMAEGLRADAGFNIKITRRKEWGDIPLPGAKADASGLFTVGEVKVTAVMEARRPQENICIMPYDVISVPKADVIYVVGSVKRSGGFTLGERETLSVLGALALAEGMERTAVPQKSKVLRNLSKEGGVRTEIAVDLKRILDGQAEDITLLPDDILFIPNSASKATFYRLSEAALQMATGAVIYRH
jgi:polysaccharide export outer membrane protein